MGGLNGLQHQIMVNVLLSVFATLQGAGALAVLWFFEPTVRAFFLWQALVAIVQVTVFRIALWRSLDSTQNATFRKEVLKGLWRFAAGISVISILSTILTQLDKVILSKMLPLAEFGYYTFAATVAAVIYRFIGPVFMAYYPRLTELVSRGDIAEVTRTYHHGSQLMSVIVLPLTLTLAFFSREILELWSNNPELVAHTYLIISLLVAGNALNGLMHLPYALQLANGWTRLALYSNLIAVIVLVPVIILAATYWGPVGAAAAWIILNSGYLLVSVQVMHRRLLTTEKWNWYSHDVGIPLLLALLVAGTGRVMMDGKLSGTLEFTGLIVILCLATAAAASSSVFVRQGLLRQFHRSW
jgi:O-antigen/teichoic acid export membrane protein